jgi:hypothetical protein
MPDDQGCREERWLEVFGAGLPCFKCDHAVAADVRHDIILILRAIKHGDALPLPPDIGGDLPANCCQRQPRIVLTSRS